MHEVKEKTITIRELRVGELSEARKQLMTS